MDRPPGYVSDNSITNRAMPYVGPVVTTYAVIVTVFVAWLIYNEYRRK